MVVAGVDVPPPPPPEGVPPPALFHWAYSVISFCTLAIVAPATYAVLRVRYGRMIQLNLIFTISILPMLLWALAMGQAKLSADRLETAQNMRILDFLSTCCNFDNTTRKGVKKKPEVDD